MPHISITYILLYFLFPIIFISISIYFSRSKELTYKRFFFANNQLRWWISGISLLTISFYNPFIFNSISSQSNFKLAIIYGVISILMIAIVYRWILPIYLKMNLNSFPEYFEKRFNRTCSRFVSVIFIFNNIFIRLFLVLIASNIMINLLTGIDSYSFILFFLVTSCIYLIIAGFQAEAYANFVQVIIVLSCLTTFLFWIFNSNSSFSYNDLSITALFQGDNSELSLVVLLPALSILSFWFWSADQIVFQKFLNSENLGVIKKVTVLSLFLQIIPIVIFIVPEIILNNFFQDFETSEAIAAFFSIGFIPDLLRGGLIVGVAAGLMAVFSNLVNSTSNLLIFNFYKRFNQKISERKTILISRLSILTLLFISILLISFSQRLNFQFSLNIFKTFTYFASLISALFIISILYKKISSVTAFLTLSIATLLITLKSISNFLKLEFLPKWFINLNFLEYSVLIFSLSILFLFLFQKVNAIQRSAYALRKIFNYSLKHKEISSYNKNIFLTISVFLIVITGLLNLMSNT